MMKFTELRIQHALEARDAWKARAQSHEAEAASLGEELFRARCLLRRLLDRPKSAEIRAEAEDFMRNGGSGTAA